MLPSPRARKAVRGKLRITEPQLVGGESWLRLTWVNWRRLVDFSDWPSHEQALADEFGEAQRGHFDAIYARREAQEQIGDHCGEDLQANSVLVGAEERADIEMLLDPAKQQFDLPAALVQGRDLDRRPLEIIGDERDRSTLVALDANTSQRNRQPRGALAGKRDLGVVDDPEAVTDDFTNIAALGRTKACVHFGARDEESPGIIDLLPPTEMIITLVEDVGRAGLDRHLAANLDIVDVGGGDLDVARAIFLGLVDDVHLHAADAPVPFGPLAHFAQRDRAGVDQAHHLGTLAPRPPVGYLRQHREGLRKNPDRAARVRIREGRTGEFADIQMIVMMGVRIEAELEPTQALHMAQLCEDQGHQVVPALERFVVGVAVVPVHDRLEPPPIDQLEKTSKDAIDVVHARPLLSLDNQKGTVCTVPAGHAPRHSESFPGQPCARGEKEARAATLRLPRHHHGSSHAHALEQVGDVLVVHADAAIGYETPDGARHVGAVD